VAAADPMVAAGEAARQGAHGEQRPEARQPDLAAMGVAGDRQQHVLRQVDHGVRDVAQEEGREPGIEPGQHRRQVGAPTAGAGEAGDLERPAAELELHHLVVEDRDAGLLERRPDLAPALLVPVVVAEHAQGGRRPGERCQGARHRGRRQRPHQARPVGEEVARQEDQLRPLGQQPLDDPGEPRLGDVRPGGVQVAEHAQPERRPCRRPAGARDVVARRLEPTRLDQPGPGAEHGQPGASQEDQLDHPPRPLETAGA
jgi:hypothetical protein